jgi:hypothetical protein
MSIRQWRHATGWSRVRAHPRLRSQPRGQALIELALILPIIPLLLAAALDLGRKNSLLSVHCSIGGCPRFFGKPVLQLTN